MNSSIQNKVYYSHLRWPIIQEIQPGKNKILDVGCGEGVLGAWLLEHGYAESVVGIEVFEAAFKLATEKLTRVINCDLNKTNKDELRKVLEGDKFNYIICGDVLEHLVDPWQMLSGLVEYLAPDGKVIVSLPNVRHWSVWIPLVFRGRWEYRDRGIMDRTHLRFFTKSSALSLLVNAGLSVSECKPLIGGLSRLMNIFTMSLMSGILGRQWVLVGKKTKNHI